MTAPVVVLSCSLSADSRSRVLAQRAARALEEAGEAVRFIDLRDVDAPLFAPDGGRIPLSDVQRSVAEARAVLVAAPIYNWDVNAAAKYLIEVTGPAWRGKVVGLLCAAGGRSSYMSLMGFAYSLMLDFRCWIVPRFVYALRSEVETDGRMPAALAERVSQLATLASTAGKQLSAS